MPTYVPSAEKMVLPWLPARKKNRIEPSPISHKSTSLASASQAPCPVVFQLVAACASNVCSDGRGLYLGTTSQQYRRARTSTYLHVLNVAAPPLTMSPRDSTMHDTYTACGTLRVVPFKAGQHSPHGVPARAVTMARNLPNIFSADFHIFLARLQRNPFGFRWHPRRQVCRPI